eukprot:6555115-Lingulodinium_polyedra.AAC.1
MAVGGSTHKPNSGGANVPAPKTTGNGTDAADDRRRQIPTANPSGPARVRQRSAADETESLQARTLPACDQPGSGTDA